MFNFAPYFAALFFAEISLLQSSKTADGESFEASPPDCVVAGVAPDRSSSKVMLASVGWIVIISEYLPDIAPCHDNVVYHRDQLVRIQEGSQALGQTFLEGEEMDADPN